MGKLDGSTIAVSVGDGKGRVWDLTAGGRLRTVLPDQGNSVWAVALSELFGTTIVVTGNLNGTVRMWDLQHA